MCARYIITFHYFTVVFAQCSHICRSYFCANCSFDVKLLQQTKFFFEDDSIETNHNNFARTNHIKNFYQNSRPFQEVGNCERRQSTGNVSPRWGKKRANINRQSECYWAINDFLNFKFPFIHADLNAQTDRNTIETKMEEKRESVSVCKFLHRNIAIYSMNIRRSFFKWCTHNRKAHEIQIQF